MSQERIRLLPEIVVSMEQVRDYEFRVRFENLPDLTMDGPWSMGHGAGPSPSQLLAASLGNCLCQSLLLAARKKGIRIASVRAGVKMGVEQEGPNRYRIHRAHVTMEPQFEGASPEQIRECVALCEELCAVTSSVREGIDVSLDLVPAGSPVSNA